MKPYQVNSSIFGDEIIWQISLLIVIITIPPCTDWFAHHIAQSSISCTTPSRPQTSFALLPPPGVAFDLNLASAERCTQSFSHGGFERPDGGPVAAPLTFILRAFFPRSPERIWRTPLTGVSYNRRGPPTPNVSYSPSPSILLRSVMQEISNTSGAMCLQVGCSFYWMQAAIKIQEEPNMKCGRSKKKYGAGIC